MGKWGRRGGIGVGYLHSHRSFASFLAKNSQKRMEFLAWNQITRWVYEIAVCHIINMCIRNASPRPAPLFLPLFPPLSLSSTHNRNAINTHTLTHTDLSRGVLQPLRHWASQTNALIGWKTSYDKFLKSEMSEKTQKME